MRPVDIVSKAEVLETYAELYDIFDDYKEIKKELHKVFDKINALSSALIRCKDCKWKQGSECVMFSDVRPFPDDFCSRAERRTDG